MVDFDNEATISTPAQDVVKILVLQRRADVLEAYELFSKQKAQGIEPDIAVLKARLMTLFLEVQAMLKRKLKKDHYNDIVKKLESEKEEGLKECIFELNDFLDQLRLTRLDTRSQYDSTRVETENRAKKL